MSDSPFSPTVQAILEEFVPICREVAQGQRYAIAVSGSLGKGSWDSRSDVDLRLYTDEPLPRVTEQPDLWADYLAATQKWKTRGVNVDEMWARPIGDIDAELDHWLSGEVNPRLLVWTIWGYHVLTDMNSQYILDDPYNIISGWKARLSVYPPTLKQAILQKYTRSLRYWRADYHYANKVDRGDVVFLAGITAKLIHEIIQILFALNETYFVGDGSNLKFTKDFAILPADFNDRVQHILYPQSTDAVASQYAALTALIDEVLALT